MNKLGGKVILILVIIAFLAILVYRINEGQH